jgi:hypothetical protein
MDFSLDGTGFFNAFALMGDEGEQDAATNSKEDKKTNRIENGF